MDKAEIAKNGPYERSYMRNSKRQHGAIFFHLYGTAAENQLFRVWNKILAAQ